MEKPYELDLTDLAEIEFDEKGKRGACCQTNRNIT